jgi:hypothetical protein
VTSEKVGCDGRPTFLEDRRGRWEELQKREVSLCGVGASAFSGRVENGSHAEVATFNVRGRPFPVHGEWSAVMKVAGTRLLLSADIPFRLVTA